MIRFCEFDIHRKFGVEFEVSPTLNKQDIANILERYEGAQSIPREVIKTPGEKGWADTRGNDYWHVKYDSTCGPLGKGKDHGWEVASYIGSTPVHISLISQAAKYMGARGVETNKNCGLHVHVNAKDLTWVQISMLFAWWLKMESFLFALCEPHRLSNPYCRSLISTFRSRQLSYNPENYCSLWDEFRPDDLEIHENDDKKVSLNTVGYVTGLINPYWNKQTVEIRMPECRLDQEHVESWITLSIWIVERFAHHPYAPYCLTTWKVSEFLTDLGLHGQHGDFVLLDERLMNLKMWILKRLHRQPGLAQEAENHLALMG